MTGPRVVCVRALDAAQASPLLEEAWHVVQAEHPGARLLLTDQPPGVVMDSPGATCVTDGATGGVADADVVVSWSVPNERTLEDLVLAEGASGVPGSLSAVYTLADKRAAKELLDRSGVPTPPWVVLDREFTRGPLLDPARAKDLERLLVRGVGLPAVVKPVWDCMGHGITVASDVGEVPAALEHRFGTVLVEQFVDGEAGSIEVLGTPGRYVFGHPAWTGAAVEGLVGDFDRVRVSHPGLFGAVLDEALRARLATALSAIGFSGACCVDFVVREGRLWVLEINPRISGISVLSSAATGVNSFEAVYRIAMGEWDEHAAAPAQGAAIQAGGESADRLARLAGPDVAVLRDRTIVVDGAESRSVVVSGALTQVEALLGEMDVRPPGLLPRVVVGAA